MKLTEEEVNELLNAIDSFVTAKVDDAVSSINTDGYDSFAGMGSYSAESEMRETFKRILT